MSAGIGETHNRMAIWFIFSGMTAAVVAVLLIPFLRKKSATQNPDSDFEQAIYRDQLQELDRDHARGIIGGVEVEAARNEISRRLLQASTSKASAFAGTSALAKLAVLIVPLLAIPIYAKFGSPVLPDVPLQERLKGAIASQDFTALVATVEAHLAEDPNDIKGWQVLAPAYKRQLRWADAAEAYLNILNLAPASAEAIADYAEMLVYANEGMVTADAQRAFEEALKLDPKDPRARYFDALAVKQEGKTVEAKKLFTDFLNDSPADASWRPMVETELRGMDGAKAPALSKDGAKAPVLSEEQMAAGQSMSADDQASMIKGMIDGLEQRLGSDSHDLDGWLRLIRARGVSNDVEKARGSLQLAMGIFKDEPASLETLNSLAKELGIN
jgi:cytochrome c-type biogenesis protein CcmH